MVDQFFRKKDEKIDFKQIILLHMKKILEVSVNEFTGGYYDFVFQANNVHKKYVTDKRAEFIQAIELLGLSLDPYFDEPMKEADKSYTKGLQDLEKKYFDDNGFLKDEFKKQYSTKKLELAKELYKELSHLLKRLDYFVQQEYEDDDSEEMKIVDVDAG